mgnify:FL=1
MVNLIYIRAAILQATGKSLSLEEVRDYLLSEGLISKRQAQDENLIFRGYDEFYGFDEAATTVEKLDHYIDRKMKHEDD